MIIWVQKETGHYQIYRNKLIRNDTFLSKGEINLTLNKFLEMTTYLGFVQHLFYSDFI